MSSDDRDRPENIWDAKARGDVDYLVRALVDPTDRVQAATFLGQLQAVEATTPLLRLLDANDPTVRFAAARALGWIGSRAARSRLREIVAGDEDDGVRAQAVVALGEIGCADDLEFLLALIEDRSLRVRGGAAVGLGRLGDARAAGPLHAARRRLRGREWYWHRKAYDLAIERLRTPKSRLAEGREERDGWGTPLAGIALVVVYVALRVFAGFWPALVVTAAGAVVLFVVRVVSGVIDAATRPPRGRSD